MALSTDPGGPTTYYNKSIFVIRHLRDYQNDLPEGYIVDASDCETHKRLVQTIMDFVQSEVAEEQVAWMRRWQKKDRAEQAKQKQEAHELKIEFLREKLLKGKQSEIEWLHEELSKNSKLTDLTIKSLRTEMLKGFEELEKKLEKVTGYLQDQQAERKQRIDKQAHSELVEKKQKTDEQKVLEQYIKVKRVVGRYIKKVMEYKQARPIDWVFIMTFIVTHLAVSLLVIILLAMAFKFGELYGKL